MKNHNAKVRIINAEATNKSRSQERSAKIVPVKPMTTATGVISARMVTNHHLVQVVVLIALIIRCCITAKITTRESTLDMTPVITRSTITTTTTTSTTTPVKRFIRTEGCDTIEHRITGQVYTYATGCAITNMVKCGRDCDIVLILLSLATTPDSFVQDANVTLNATAFADWLDAYNAGKLTGNYYFFSDKYEDYDYIRYYLYDRAIVQSQLDWLEPRLSVLTQIHVSQSARGYEVDIAAMRHWSAEGSFLAGMVNREVARGASVDGKLVFMLQENGVTGQYVKDGEIPNYVLLRWGPELISNHLSPMEWEPVRGMTAACAVKNAHLADVGLRELVAEHHWNSNLILGAKQICADGWTLSVTHELDYNSLPFSGFGLAPSWPLAVFNTSYYDGQPHDYLSRLPLAAIRDRFILDKVIVNDRAHKVFSAVQNISSVEFPPYHSYVVMSNSSYGSVAYTMMYVVEYETCSILVPVIQEFVNLIAFVAAYGLSCWRIWYYYTGKYQLYAVIGMGSLGSMRFVALCVMSSVTIARLALYTFAGNASNWTLRTVIYLMMLVNVVQFKTTDPWYNVVFSTGLSLLAVLSAMIVGTINGCNLSRNCVCNEFRMMPRLNPGRFDDFFRLEGGESFISGKQMTVRGILETEDGKWLYSCECVYAAAVSNLFQVFGLTLKDRRLCRSCVKVTGRHARGLHASIPLKTRLLSAETLIGGVIKASEHDAEPPNPVDSGRPRQKEAL